MAAHSVSSISQLLLQPHPPPPSLKNGLFLVDFVGLYCKSNRTRRKLGASVNHHQSLARRRRASSSSSSVKAVLDLERSDVALDETRGRSDLEPKVWCSWDFLLSIWVFEWSECGRGRVQLKGLWTLFAPVLVFGQNYFSNFYQLVKSELHETHPISTKA